MKKIVSNVLIVSTQLIIGGLFLFMLFSDNSDDNKVVVVQNDNLNKMADSVTELFVADQMQEEKLLANAKEKEEKLLTEEEKKAQEEAEAKKKAEEEAQRKAQEEAEAKKKAEEEAQRKRAEEEAARARNAIVASAGGYNSKPGAGFNVTTGNRTYSLSDAEFNAVSGVIGCEGTNRDDMLAVASVILNRADRRGMTPYQVVAQAGQFSCFYHQASPSKAAGVLRDALNGIRNNSYNSFNGWYSGVSDNYIAAPGNRYY